MHSNCEKCGTAMISVNNPPGGLRCPACDTIYTCDLVEVPADVVPLQFAAQPTVGRPDATTRAGVVTAIVSGVVVVTVAAALGTWALINVKERAGLSPSRSVAGEPARPRVNARQMEEWERALCSDLQTVRSQIELYKVQHLEKLPGWRPGDAWDGNLFVRQLTSQTTVLGDVGTHRELYSFGPYLQKFPKNPFVAGEAASQVKVGQGPCPGNGSSGWYFDTRSGKFSPNDRDHRGF